MDYTLPSAFMQGAKHYLRLVFHCYNNLNDKPGSIPQDSQFMVDTANTMVFSGRGITLFVVSVLPKSQPGFTLAELLIALAILGVIATFTIPKILASQQGQKNNALTHEAASMVAAAYATYINQNQPSTTIGIAALTPYMNYLNTDTSSNMDKLYGTAGTQTCNTTAQCLRLHSGALLMYWPADYFGGTATTNGIPFWVDPDGQLTDTSASGADKSIRFILYYNGRVTDMANQYTATTYNGGGNTNNPSASPPWFNW